MKAVVRAAELVYRGVNRVRRALYRTGILKAKKLPAPVISVGNIAIGGGGKTPTVIAIARALSDRGLRVGVLTRGYRRSGEGGVVDSNDVRRFGDEPVLIKKSAPNASVIVGKNRADNALRYPCDVYVLDDGFQHLQLHRDLDIVIDVPDATLFRESRAALRDADLVLPRRVIPNVPDSLQGKRVFAFAGLANNEQFFDALRQNGLTIIGTRGFPDHHRYSAADIASIKREAARADAIVTTEKDGVKIDDPAIIAIPAAMELDPIVLQRVFAVAKR